MLVVIGPAGAKTHTRPGHPERPARIDAVMAGVDDLHLGSDLVTVEPRKATTEDLTPIHDVGYLERLERFCAQGGGALDADTYAVTDSWNAALLAAGAGLTALEELETRGGVAFVPVRPPGHHALAARPMGFCLLNNVAVAAAKLRDAGERVLIVDWDVHHGNGTQDLFWDEPDVLYVSVHQSPCYPGTGAASEVGGPAALGSTLNVPVPPGATGDVVRTAFDLAGRAGGRAIRAHLGTRVGGLRRAPRRSVGRARALRRRLRRVRTCRGRLRAAARAARPLPRGRLRPRSRPLLGVGDARRVDRRQPSLRAAHLGGPGDRAGPGVGSGAARAAGRSRLNVEVRHGAN